MAPRHRRPPRTTRWQRGTAVVPLAVLGAAWALTFSSPTGGPDDAGASGGYGSVTADVPTVAYAPAAGSSVGRSTTPGPTVTTGESSAPTTSGGYPAGTTASPELGRPAEPASGSGLPDFSTGGVTTTEAPGPSSTAPAPSGSRGSTSPTATTASAPSTPGTTGPVVQRLDNVAQATAYCAQHLPGNPTQEMITACGAKLVGATTDEAAHLLSGTLVQVLTRLGLTPLTPVTPPASLPCLPVFCLG